MRQLKKLMDDDDVMTQNALNHPFLLAQYRVQCMQILYELKQTTTDHMHLDAIIRNAQRMADRLETIYRRINELNDANLMRRDQYILRCLLSPLPLEETPVPPLTTSNHAQSVRNIHANVNPIRLIMIRLRRVIMFGVRMPELAAYRDEINAIERYTGPFFLHLAWVFFTPRLLANSLSLVRPCSAHHDQPLPWFTQLRAQISMHRRVFEVINDIFWGSSGLLCILFTPAWRAYAAIFMQIFDLIVTYSRSYIEINRLLLLRNRSQVDRGFVEALNQRLAFETACNRAAVQNNVLLLIAIITIFPSIATMYPILPVLGGLLALACSALTTHNNATFQKSRPHDDLGVIMRTRFFKPATLRDTNDPFAQLYLNRPQCVPTTITTTAVTHHNNT